MSANSSRPAIPSDQGEPMNWTVMFVSREEAQTALARIRKGSTVGREAVELEVSSKTLRKALEQLMGTEEYEALMGRVSRAPQRPASVAAALPRERPRTAPISSGEQLQAVLDRIHGGSNVKAEAQTLGLRYNVLRVVLQQLIGSAAYEALMAEGRARRAKLPPSTPVPSLPSP